MMKLKEMVMDFVSYETNSIDIKRAWMATNTEKEVDIIENINEEYELWIENNFVSMHESFETTKRIAETLVTFRVAYT